MISRVFFVQRLSHCNDVEILISKMKQFPSRWTSIVEQMGKDSSQTFHDVDLKVFCIVSLIASRCSTVLHSSSIGRCTSSATFSWMNGSAVGRIFLMSFAEYWPYIAVINVNDWRRKRRRDAVIDLVRAKD